MMIFAYLVASTSVAVGGADPAKQDVKPVPIELSLLFAHLVDPEVAKDIKRHPARAMTGKVIEVQGQVVKATYNDKEKKHQFQFAVRLNARGRVALGLISLFFDDAEAAEALARELARATAKRPTETATGILEFLDGKPCLNGTKLMPLKKTDR